MYLYTEYVPLSLQGLPGAESMHCIRETSMAMQWSCPLLCRSLVIGEEHLRAMELKVTKWLVLGHAVIPRGPLSNQTSSLPPWSGFFFLPVPIVAYFMRAVHSKDTKTVGVH